MTPHEIRQLAEQLLTARIGVDEFTAKLSAAPVADVGVAQVDLDRQRRCGFPEVVYGESKSAESLEKIFSALLAAGVTAFATRVDAVKAATLTEVFPTAHYNPLARTFRIPLQGPAAQTDENHPVAAGGKVAVITAGTSDLPVAEEARETLEWMGAETTLIQDVGVAGPHRLPARLPEFLGSDVVVVVAGMEAALPSVVGGYVDCPVIGVPTSVGYGASLGGIAGLLGTLNSCAANVTVVNIDAGFKGGYVAGLIAGRAAKARAQR